MATNKAYDDVQLDVNFTQASTRANLTSEENISISFGKLSKWYEALVPTGGSSGQFLGWNSDGTAKWVSNPNSDTKVTDTVGTANTYYPAGLTGTSTATGTQVFDTSFKFIGTTGTTSAVGKAQLVLGNSTASGAANNKQGSLVIYGSTAYAHTIQGAPTAARTLTIPDKTGTFALTSDIPSVPTVNDAALTLKGAGTTVTTFTANASADKSLDIVAGSNVTVTADATNAKISIASTHPAIEKAADTTSTVSPAHGGTFTVVDSITRETNGHVTKINTKTVTLPADSNTDTKVTQSSSTTSNFRPVMLGYTNTTTVNDLAATVTNQVYATTNLFHKPSTGCLYATAFSTAGYVTGSGAQLLGSGLYLKAYKVQTDDSVLNYGRYVVRTYSGKAKFDPSSTSPNGAGMLATFESGGLVIIGSGESATALSNLISDDQSDAYVDRTSLDVGGTLNTSLSGSSEQLLLSSDNSIYFITNCNTITDRKPVVLDTNTYFYPGTTGTGSIGTSTYKWNSAYINTIYEGSTKLSDKYAPISHTHGNITNGGALQTTDITIASGDKLVVTDSSDSNKVARASISFDGSTATKCLTQKGTWETFASSNTDTLVSQTFATADHNRPLLMSYYYTGVETTTAQVVHRNDALYFNPSGGILRSPRLYLQTTGMPITINLDTLQPTAGENVNVLAVKYKNTDGTATHTVCPIGIFGNDATGSSATVNSGVRLGSTNGTTIVGAGESSATLAAAQAKYNDENLYFVADGAVYMYTSCSNDSTTVTGPWRVGGFTTGTSAITSGRVMITDGTAGGFKASDYTIAKSVPSNALFTDTWTAMVGATSSANGSVGYVNAVPPKDGYNTKYLRADGTWAVPTNTTYSAGTGLSLSGTTFNHSNSVTAKEDYNKKFFTHDSQGHITANSWCIHEARGTNGSNSDSTWIKIATLVHTSTYNNAPITITFTQRGNTTRNRLTIRFSSVNSNDPSLALFLLTCDALWASSNSRALIVKTATSTWDIYIKKLDTHELIHVSDFDIGSTGSTKLTWTWQDEQVTTTPADATEATKKVYSTTDHTHSYAGSSSAGGAAISANKLNTDAGGTYLPVYFSNGVPAAVTVKNNTSVGTIGWTSGAGANAALVTVNSIAYWNGAYSGTSSNLAYCKKGEFGSIVTKNTGDYYSATTTRTANYVLAGPSSGSAAAATFRALVADDLPSHTHSDYVLKTGDTMSGNLTLSKSSGDTYYYSERTDTGVNVRFGVGSGGTNHGIYSGKLGGWMIYGNDTDVLVRSTLYNPSDYVDLYAIPLLGATPSTGAKALYNTNGFRYSLQEGTSALVGTSRLILGNGTASGSAGNKKGSIRLYSENQSYIDLIPESTTSASALTIPAIPAANADVISAERSSLITDSSAKETVNAYPWHKFAEITITTTNQDENATFLVSLGYGRVTTEYTGILKVHLRTGSDKTLSATESTMKWLVAGACINPEDFVMKWTNTSGTSAAVELWMKMRTNGQYDGWTFKIIKENTRTTKNTHRWTLVDGAGQGAATHGGTIGTNAKYSSLALCRNVQGVYTVIGTQTASTSAWTGKLDIPDLYDGLTIAYYLPYASTSTSVTLNLTLLSTTGTSETKTTGAINCYSNSTTRITTHYGAGSTILLTYWSAGSISVSGTATSEARWTRCDYNADTKTRQTLASGNSNRPLLMSYGTTSTTDSNVDNVTYRNNSIYANPSTGTITATKFNGNITGAGLNAGIYELLNTDSPVFDGEEWMLTSIPSSSGGTSEPSFRRVKTGKFADYVNSASRKVLFDQSSNTSTSVTLSAPPADTQYLKLYFRSSGNNGQDGTDTSVYSIAEVPYMTGVYLGGILQVAQNSDNSGIVKFTALAFTVRITSTSSNYTLTLTKAPYPSRIDGSTVVNDSYLSANIIKVVAYR